MDDARWSCGGAPGRGAVSVRPGWHPKARTRLPWRTVTQGWCGQRLRFRMGDRSRSSGSWRAQCRWWSGCGSGPAGPGPWWTGSRLPAPPRADARRPVSPRRRPPTTARSSGTGMTTSGVGRRCSATGRGRIGVLLCRTGPGHRAGRASPSLVDVGGIETFRDECIEYANRLMASGVSTELHVYPAPSTGSTSWPPKPGSACWLGTCDGRPWPGLWVWQRRGSEGRSAGRQGSGQRHRTDGSVHGGTVAIGFEVVEPTAE